MFLFPLGDGIIQICAGLFNMQYYIVQSVLVGSGLLLLNEQLIHSLQFNLIYIAKIHNNGCLNLLLTVRYKHSNSV